MPDFCISWRASRGRLPDFCISCKVNCRIAAREDGLGRSSLRGRLYASGADKQSAVIIQAPTKRPYIEISETGRLVLETIRIEISENGERLSRYSFIAISKSGKLVLV